MATNNDFVCDYLISEGAVEFLNFCFTLRETKYIREIIWCFSNFFASGKNIISLIKENEEVLNNFKNCFKINSTSILEELFYCLGNYFYNSDFICAKKLIDLKFDEEIFNLLKETKNSNLIAMSLEIINIIIDIPFYVEKEGEKFQEMENELYPKFIKVKNPLIRKLMENGILDILSDVEYRTNDETIEARIKLLESKINQE